MSEHVDLSPIYFIGCDMGGWHTDNGDAMAVLKWSEGQPTKPISAQCGIFFYPIEEHGPLESAIVRAHEDGGRIVISIDAALAWPSRFVELASMAPRAQHEASFILADAISNPYLYRETERSACWLMGPSIRS